MPKNFFLLTATFWLRPTNVVFVSHYNLYNCLRILRDEPLKGRAALDQNQTGPLASQEAGQPSVVRFMPGRWKVNS